MTIHPTAVIEDGAVIGDNCSIGAYAVIGPEVVLEAGVTVLSHVAIDGCTRIGSGTKIWPFASIGHQPQDLKFRGEKTELVIGQNNMIREHVTMNPGTEGGGGVTRVGDNGLYMMGVHIGHDCVVGSGVVLANNASLGGHVVVEDSVIIGALSGVHQFCRIGQGAIIGGMSAVDSDVIPYGSVRGDRAFLNGLNLIGLRRRNIPKEAMSRLTEAYDTLFREEGTLAERTAQIADQFGDDPLVKDVVTFLQDGTRPVCTPKAG
jgi:UDP-N-acetylglucosamine acyltransferase